MGEWVIILQHTFSRMTFVGSYDNARIRYVRDGIKSPKQHGEKEQEEGLDKEKGWMGSMLVGPGLYTLVSICLVSFLAGANSSSRS